MDPRTAAPTPEDLLAQAGFLRRLARGLVADASAADDLAQDALVAAVTRPPGAPGSGRGWLATVAANLARNARRDAARRGERERRAARAEAAEDGSALESLEVQRALFDLLLALPEEQRTVLHLRYYEDLGPAAIAKRLGVPLKTVKSRHARGIAALRARLDARSGGDRRRWLDALAPFALADGASVAWLSGGLLVKKLAVAGVVVLLAVLAWWTTAGAERADPDADVRPIAMAAPTPPPARAVELAAAIEPEARAVSVEAERATRGDLVVELTWSDGTPAIGIGVEAQCAGDPAPRAETTRAVTDAAGRARFDALFPGAVTLRPDLRKQFSGDVVAGETRTVVHVLPHGIEVAGRVVDAGGAPVSNAQIWCAGSPREGLELRFAQACAPDGTFRLRDVALDPYFGARAAGHGASACVRPRELPIGPDGTRTVELALRPAGGRLRGRVLDPEGAPLAGARVHAGTTKVKSIEIAGRIRAMDEWPACATTAADGTFAAFEDLAIGRVEVNATARGYGVWSGAVDVSAGATATLEIRLERAARVTGVLLDLDGRPMPGVKVAAVVEEQGGWTWPAFPPSAVKSGADGRFDLAWIAPGPCELNASDERRPAIGRARALVTARAGATTECELRLERGNTIAGRVEDAQGAPLAGWHVSADNEWRSWYPRDATTAADGTFEVLNLGDGECDVHVRAPDYGPTRASLARVAVGTRDARIVVADAHVVKGSLRARVVDPAGGPLGDLAATLWPAGRNEGRFLKIEPATGIVAADTVAGRYRLVIARSSLVLATSGEFAVEEGGVADLGDLVLAGTGRVEITLAGAPRDALTKFALMLERYDVRANSENLVARDGAWRSDVIPAGTWTVTLLDDAWSLRTAEVEARDGETVRVELAVEPAVRVPIEVSGDVRGALVIEVRDGEGRFLERERWASGARTLPYLTVLGLPSGRVVISARGDDGASARAEAVVDALRPLTQPVRLVLGAPR